MLSRYKWLTAATSKIRFPPDRKMVQQELSDHIEDLCDRYTTTGLDAEAAEAAALEAMGDPETIAADLGRIHRPWQGYLWWLSKGLLIAAIGTFIIVSAMQIYRNPVEIPLYGLPGWEYYDYLTWKFEIVAGEPEQYDHDLVPNGAVTTGGYTIRTTRAQMRLSEDPVRGPQRWNLLFYFQIDTNWRGEELYWGPNTITEVRDDSGNTYDNQASEANKCYLCGASNAVPLLGQKAALELNGVPEDTEWIELDIGYGNLQRTLHIDLKEAAT